LYAGFEFFEKRRFLLRRPEKRLNHGKSILAAGGKKLSPILISDQLNPAAAVHRRAFRLTAYT